MPKRTLKLHIGGGNLRETAEMRPKKKDVPVQPTGRRSFQAYMTVGGRGSGDSASARPKRQ